MLRLYLLISVGFLMLFAKEQVLQMPPPVPNIDATQKLPKECEAIPPMIYQLPPPLEAMVQSCKNELYKPDISKIKGVFGKGIQNVSIKKLDGFSKMYEVVFVSKDKKMVRYCNGDISYCFITKPQKMENIQ